MAHRKGLKRKKHKAWCLAYRNRGQKLKNKLAKLRRLVARSPHNQTAVARLAELS